MTDGRIGENTKLSKRMEDASESAPVSERLLRAFLFEYEADRSLTGSLDLLAVLPLVDLGKGLLSLESLLLGILLQASTDDASGNTRILQVAIRRCKKKERESN